MMKRTHFGFWNILRNRCEVYRANARKEQAMSEETRCPECDEPTPQDELDMFDGLCEYCVELRDDEPNQEKEA